MIKKVYIIIISVLLFMSIPLYRPFKIYGATVGGYSPIIGVNISVTDFERTYDREFRIQELNLTDGSTYFRCTSSSANPCTQWTNGNTLEQFTLEYTIDDSSYTIDEKQLVYTYEFILDNNYVGYVKFVNPFIMDSVMGSTHQYSTFYVNGSSFTISGTQLITSWTVDSYELNLINYTHWNFPIESFSYISFFDQRGYELVQYMNLGQYIFPFYKVNTGDYLHYLNYICRDTFYHYLIFYIDQNCNNINQFKNMFTFDDVIVIDELKQISLLNDLGNATSNKYLLKIKFHIPTGNERIFRGFVAKRNMIIMPVYYSNDNYQQYISTDFALTFNLTNRLLDNLDIIANGNTTSSSSVSSATTTNQQAQQTFTQEEQIVNNAEDDLQDNLIALDIQNKNNNLFGNSKFVASAQWVKLQFDNLTNNNAFGYMITFSLVIGIALVIVGKLRG